MTDLITEIWAGLKDAGMPDVMLYLADGSATGATGMRRR